MTYLAWRRPVRERTRWGIDRYHRSVGDPRHGRCRGRQGTSITVELETANGGAVLDVTSYLMWRRTWRST
jgi:hypothetical protein